MRTCTKGARDFTPVKIAQAANRNQVVDGDGGCSGGDKANLMPTCPAGYMRNYDVCYGPPQNPYAQGATACRPAPACPTGEGEMNEAAS